MMLSHHKWRLNRNTENLKNHPNGFPMTFYPIYVEIVTFNINSYPRVQNHKLVSFFCDFGELPVCVLSSLWTALNHCA